MPVNAVDLARRVASEMDRAGLRVFKRPMSLNVVGLRSPGRIAGKYDDALVAFYWDADSQLRAEAYPVTTDPSARSLSKGNDSRGGTAILVPGQYAGSHVLGRHKGKYPALVQQGRTPVKVWRDDDRDDVLDMRGGEGDDEGYFGINIHASSSNPFDEIRDNLRNPVGPWSEGCQVFARTADFRRFIAIVRRSAMKYGKTFTYTLLDWDETLFDSWD